MRCATDAAFLPHNGPLCTAPLAGIPRTGTAHNISRVSGLDGDGHGDRDEGQPERRVAGNFAEAVGCHAARPGSGRNRFTAMLCLYFTGSASMTNDPRRRAGRLAAAVVSIAVDIENAARARRRQPP
jgi:hypothetical protein